MGTTFGHRPLPSGPVAASTARREISSACSGLPPTTVELATLLTSELVTNAVTHGRHPVYLVIDLDQARLLVEVTDAGTGTPQVVDRGQLALTGRGLRIVDSKADAWGCGRDDAGTTVWFLLRLPPG